MKKFTRFLVIYIFFTLCNITPLEALQLKTMQLKNIYKANFFYAKNNSLKNKLTYLDIIKKIPTGQLFFIEKLVKNYKLKIQYNITVIRNNLPTTDTFNYQDKYNSCNTCNNYTTIIAKTVSGYKLTKQIGLDLNIGLEGWISNNKMITMNITSSYLNQDKDSFIRNHNLSLTTKPFFTTQVRTRSGNPIKISKDLNKNNAKLNRIDIYITPQLLLEIFGTTPPTTIKM
ncbi:MAG: hypothetical protein BKP49_08370 [Treponema sp. CETP13]|nr:MAG: hypothetical protein BKP49_08370 [Treponema sp. CETP13]